MERDFELVGAAYLSRPTGQEAVNLEQLAAHIERADDATLFHHTQMPRLDDPDDGDVPADDFSNWIRGVVQDPETAERVAFAVQVCPADSEALRGALLDVLHRVSPGRRSQRSAPEGGAFVFLQSDVVPVPLGMAADSVEALMPMLMVADRSIWFHHCVEEAWLLPGATPIVEWLTDRHEDALARWFDRAASRGLSVEDLRSELQRHWRRSLARRRALDPHHAAADAHDVMRSFARRLARVQQP